jgi:hypothetical protein
MNTVSCPTIQAAWRGLFAVLAVLLLHPLPAWSSRGEKAATASFPGATATIPPPTPVLAGNSARAMRAIAHVSRRLGLGIFK